MKYLKQIPFLIILLAISNCDEEAGSTANFSTAQVVGFDSSKCFCCWGWIIKVGSDTIKSDYIPGLSMSEKTVFPIDARIDIGNRTIDCSGDMADYFEIKEFIELK